ncbi:hypothetical protein Lser_V15G35623 [Lactuca serriola]
MGYIEILTTVTKFKKSCPPPQWNGFFTVLFKGLLERSAGSDGASRLFMMILYGLYHGVNLDYGSLLWQKLIQSLASTSRHSEISYARFWTLVTKWAMDKYHVPVVANSPLSSIVVFHTTKIIVTDPSKFQFVGSIHESMYACVSRDSQKGKDKKVVKGVKGPSPKKRKPTKSAQSPLLKKRKTQPRRKLILASSSSESEDEDLDSEESLRGDTPPRSPSPEGAAESNATKVDSVVEKLVTSFASELQSFASLHQSLDADHKTFQMTVEERLTKLQEDLASENSVMDALAHKTTVLKVRSLQLSQSEKEVASLRSERAKQAREKDSDMSARVAREAEGNERKMEAHDRLESRKNLFPPWTLERLIKEAIDTPSILWLELGSVDNDEFGDMQVWSTDSEDDEVRKPSHGKAYVAKSGEADGRYLMVTDSKGEENRSKRNFESPIQKNQRKTFGPQEEQNRKDVFGPESNNNRRASFRPPNNSRQRPDFSPSSFYNKRSSFGPPTYNTQKSSFGSSSISNRKSSFGPSNDHNRKRHSESQGRKNSHSNFFSSNSSRSQSSSKPNSDPIKGFERKKENFFS